MRALHLTATLGVLLSVALPTRLSAQGAPDEPPAEAVTPPEEPRPQKPREVLEKEFAKALSNCELVGQFTVEGQPQNPGMKPDRYLIARVAKTEKDDYWTFVYVHKRIPIPLVLRVIWAGNTPVLTLDEFTIAGMGTFSARVMFDLKADLYAGTWQHGDVGGLMFGRIERADPPPRASTALDRLKSNVTVSFNREPLKDAFDEIAKQTKCEIIVDGDGLKVGGYTKNIPVSFDQEDTGMAAVRKIIDRYQGMCIVLEDNDAAIRITTKRYAEARRQRVLGDAPAS